MIPANLLPAAYQQSYCVAGGWAATPALADDQDVWVYRVPVDSLNKVRQELLDHIATVNRLNRPRSFYVKPQEEGRTVEGFDNYIGVNVSILKVGIIEPKVGARAKFKPIHLMVCSAFDINQILQGFDVSTHAVAINWNGEVHEHRHFTAPHEAPRALLYNEKTSARLKRIAARFGHPVPEEVTIG